MTCGRLRQSTSGIQRSAEMIGPISQTPVIRPYSEQSISRMFQPCDASNLMPTASRVGLSSDAAEEELRAGRAGVLGAVADPDIGDPPVAHDRVAQVAAAPDEIGFGMGLGRELRQSDAGLAGAAEVHDQELKLAGSRRSLGAVVRPVRRVGERDRDVQADRRVDLRLGPDAGRQVEALHERRLELPGQAVVADPDRVLQDPFDVLPLARLVDRRQPGMLLGRELLDVLLAARTSRERCRARAD